MKITRKHLLIAASLLLAVGLACGFNVSTAKVSKAEMNHEVNGGYEPTKTFNQNEVFYLLVKLDNAPDDTKTKAVWYAEDAEGVQKNTKLDEAEYTGGGEITFHLSNNQLWPVGKYKVEFFLNDKLNQTLEFNVAASAAAPAAPAAPAANSGGVTITDAYMVRYKGSDYVKVASYGQDEDFYCDVELSDYTKGNKVKVEWFAVNAQGVDANTVLYTQEGSSTGSALEFQLSNDQKWPLGDYSAQISLDGVIQGHVDFKVE